MRRANAKKRLLIIGANNHPWKVAARFSAATPLTAGNFASFKASVACNNDGNNALAPTGS
jgi:hypothetical protein